MQQIAGNQHQESAWKRDMNATWKAKRQYNKTTLNYAACKDFDNKPLWHIFKKWAVDEHSALLQKTTGGTAHIRAWNRKTGIPCSLRLGKRVKEHHSVTHNGSELRGNQHRQSVTKTHKTQHKKARQPTNSWWQQQQVRRPKCHFKVNYTATNEKGVRHEQERATQRKRTNRARRRYRPRGKTLSFATRANRGKCTTKKPSQNEQAELQASTTNGSDTRIDKKPTLCNLAKTETEAEN